MSDGDTGATTGMMMDVDQDHDAGNDNVNVLTASGDNTSGLFSPAEIAAQNMASDRARVNGGNGHQHNSLLLDVENNNDGDEGGFVETNNTNAPNDTSLQEINIDPLPRENMILEGAEDGGLVDVRHRRWLICTGVVVAILAMATVIGVAVPLAIHHRSPSMGNMVTSGGPMTGNDLLLDEDSLEATQEGGFGSDADSGAMDDSDTSPPEDDVDAMLAIARRDAIMVKLRAISPNVVESPATAQYEAANFIIHNDPLKLDPESSRLTQRYVIALLYYSLGGDNWAIHKRSRDLQQGDGRRNLQDGGATASTTMLSSSTECQWTGITCNANQAVREIKWMNNTMEGVVPQEIGHLVHLGELCLYLYLQTHTCIHVCCVCCAV
jgi:hypothetical protein